ncbi:MAG: hypothetical protein EBU93_01615 [Chlamydiae bacterium]|nr:hypothetical protein [Chlamydiota bacterium]
MNIVLVCLSNFQPYILTNIQQLILLKHSDIYVITHSVFFHHFDVYKSSIHLVDVGDLPDSFDYYNKTTLNKHFRNGFWAMASLRFFYIYELMNLFHLTNVIHLENDVLLYYNIDQIIPKLDNRFLYIPFDSFSRNIASILYIPNSHIFKMILDSYRFDLSDMDNFSHLFRETGLIQPLPIFSSFHAKTSEEQFVSSHFDKIGFIFDAAAMGQFLGGIDPLNDPGNTVGFVNETCVIKYNKYSFVYDGFLRPFLSIDDSLFPIFNLHIHSKKLENHLLRSSPSSSLSSSSKLFLGENQDSLKIIQNNTLFDVVICVGKNDVSLLPKVIALIRLNVIGFRKIFLICLDPDCIRDIVDDSCVIIDEKIFPFTIHDMFPENVQRNGWYLQQLLKLYASFVIHDILDNYLVVDCDVFFLQPTSFICQHTAKFFITNSYLSSLLSHPPYFQHMNRLHPSLKSYHSFSGITHHFIFNKQLLIQLFLMVESYHHFSLPFWKLFLNAVDPSLYNFSGASEYEIYFHYLIHFHPDKIILRDLSWMDLPFLSPSDLVKYSFVAIHHYNRARA